MRRCAGRTCLARRGSCVSFYVLSSAWLAQAHAALAMRVCAGMDYARGGAVFISGFRYEEDIVIQSCFGISSISPQKNQTTQRNKSEHPLSQQPQKGGTLFRARSPPTKSRNPTKQMRISAFPNNPKKGGTSFRARSPRKSNNPTKQCERQIDFYCFFAENELL